MREHGAKRRAPSQRRVGDELDTTHHFVESK